MCFLVSWNCRGIQLEKLVDAGICGFARGSIPLWGAFPELPLAVFLLVGGGFCFFAVGLFVAICGDLWFRVSWNCRGIRGGACPRPGLRRVGALLFLACLCVTCFTTTHVDTLCIAAML